MIYYLFIYWYLFEHSPAWAPPWVDVLKWFRRSHRLKSSPQKDVRPSAACGCARTLDIEKHWHWNLLEYIRILYIYILYIYNIIHIHIWMNRYIMFIHIYTYILTVYCFLPQNEYVFIRLYKVRLWKPFHSRLFAMDLHSSDLQQAWICRNSRHR